MINRILSTLLPFKTGKFKRGDRVFYKYASRSQKKIDHQGHLGVWVIDDITDAGYRLNLEGGAFSMFCNDFELESAPENVKNIPYKVGNVEIVLS